MLKRRRHFLAVLGQARDAAEVLVSQDDGRDGLRGVVAGEVERANLSMLAAGVVQSKCRAAGEQPVVDACRHLRRRQAGRTCRCGGCPGTGAASATRRAARAAATSGWRRRVWIGLILRLHLGVVAPLGGRVLLEGHPDRVAHVDDGALHLRRHLLEVRGELFLSRTRARCGAAASRAATRGRRLLRSGPLWRRDLHDRRDHHALGRWRPAEDLEHQVVLDRSDDEAVGLLVQPADPLAFLAVEFEGAEVERLELAIGESPALHALNGPLGGVLVVG